MARVLIMFVSAWLILCAGVSAQQQQGPDPELASVRRASSTALLNLADKNVSIRYNPQITDQTAALKQIGGLREGAVIAFDQAAALRLRTETDLAFGAVVIKTENQAPNYPGVYSIWLKKEKDGWRLAFNSDADIWGTHHDPAHDVAEAPLQWKKLNPPAKNLSVELKKDTETAGLLRIAWGPHEWTARFTVATK